MIRIDSPNQLNYLNKFLMNYLANKNKIAKLVNDIKKDLAFAKGSGRENFSSFRLEDTFSNIDFCEFANKGILFIFMAITHKRKPHDWKAEDYFIL